MQRWGTILDCEKEKDSLNANLWHQCFQLEDKASPSNIWSLSKTTTSIESQVPGVDNTEQINSVFEDINQVDMSQESREVAGAHTKDQTSTVFTARDET